GTTAGSPVWTREPAAPLAHAGNPVMAPAVGVDIEFNSSPSEKWTAFVNAHKTMSKVVRWLDLPEGTIPTIPVVAAISRLDWVSCSPEFKPPSVTGGEWPGGALVFGPSNPDCFGTTEPLPNTAYSTIIAHEYGHCVAWNLMGIDLSPGHEAFHEGFGDVLALLAFDTEIIGEDIHGCDKNLRWPPNPATGKKAVFP